MLLISLNSRTPSDKHRGDRRRGLWRIERGEIMGEKSKKVVVENVNIPGHSTNVDAVKYKAMKEAFLKVLPASAPGLTQNEIQLQVKAFLPEAIFPAGKTSGWWAKTVQLDLEAKGLVTREKCKPLRWHKC